ALVFGRRAGRSAAERAQAWRGRPPKRNAARDALDLLAADAAPAGPNTAEMVATLPATMADKVGPLRDQTGLEAAPATIPELTGARGERPAGDGRPFDLARLDWLDLRNMLTVAWVVAAAALRRTESRGAHQREDHPGMLDRWRVNQVARLDGNRIALAEQGIA